jgi:transposase
VLAFVGVLRALNQAIGELDRSVIARLDEHPDAKIFASLPRSGQINAAQMLACWGDCRDAYDDPEAVAALAGIVPVTRQSGKHTAVSFRWACNKRFGNAITTFAHNSRLASPGPPRSTPTPSPAATTTPTPPASLLAPGSG